MKALVVGYGSIGRRHISNLTKFFDVKVLVCTKRGYDKFLLKNHCKIFKTLDECIEEKPEIAIIANITNLHVKTAMKLVNAGINLFIEKPLSNSLIGIDSLLNLVKKRKVVTLMGCNMRFHPAIKKIKNIISDNEIGKVISVHVENGSFLPEWHPYEDYRNSYAAHEYMSGGVVLTNIHEIDYLYWIFGNVKEVFSITGRFSDLKLTTDDLSVTLLKFKNDIIAEVHLDYFQRPNFRSCKIIGTKGTIYWDSTINTVKVYDIKKKRWIVKLRLKNYDYNSTYVDEMAHFIRCTRKKEASINNINEGMKVLKIGLAIKKASKIKKGVKLS